MRRCLVRVAPGIFLTVFLAGCGGGGGSGNDSGNDVGGNADPSEKISLYVVGPQQPVSAYESEPVEFEIKLQNSGAKTAKNIHISALPPIFSVVRDNCSEKALAPATECTLTLELYDEKVESGVAPLQFVYDYAGQRNRSVEGSVSYTVAASQWRSVAEWGGHNGDAKHSGFVPVTLKPEWFSERWSVNLFPGFPLNQVSIGEGKVFVTPVKYFGEQELNVVNLDAGTTAWNYKFGTIHSVHPAAYADGRVYVTTGGHSDAALWSFNAQDGSVKFRSQISAQWERYLAPTVIGGNVYINGGTYGGAYGFDGTSGDRLWFASLNQYDQWTPAVDEKYVYAYTGSYSPNLSVLSKSDGSVVSEIPDPEFVWSGWSIGFAPVLGQSGNVLVTNGGRLISFDTVNRRIGWQKTASFSGQVSLAKGEIYVSNNGQVDIRRESDGELLSVWVPPNGERVRGNIIATNNLFFASTAIATYGVDRLTQQVAWSVPKSGHLSLSNEGKLIIAGNGGELTAVGLRYRRP